MTDINDIKAGDYELLVLSWDETTSEPDKPFTFKRHYKGDTVTLSEEEARRLVPVGAVAPAGALAAAKVEQARQQYLAALALLPDNLRAQLQTTDPAELAEQAEQEPSPEELTVATAGLANEGDRPRVAGATVGEGTGGPENGEGEAGEAPTATVETGKTTARRTR